MPFIKRKYKRIIKILSIILIPIMIIFGIKGFILYNTKKAIDDLSIQYADYAKINYESIDVSLSGRITVNNITIFIPINKKTFQAQSISLNTDDLFSLVSLSQDYKYFQLTNSLSLFINGLNLVLDKSPSINDQNLSHFEHVSSLACGDTSHFDEQFLTKIGFNNLKQDISLSYNFNPISNELFVSASTHAIDFFTADLSLTIQQMRDFSLESLIALFMLPTLDSSPKLGQVELVLKDELFFTRKNIYCAEMNNSTIDMYLDNHTQLISQYLNNLNIYPNKSIISAYKNFISTSPLTKIDLNFSQVSNYLTLLSSTPNQLFKLLDAKLSLNESDISPLSINIKKVSKRSTTSIELKKTDSRIRKYRPVSINKVHLYSGYATKVITTTGRNLEGKLKMHGRYNIEVITRKRKGQLSYHFPIEEVKSIQIYD